MTLEWVGMGSFPVALHVCARKMRTVPQLWGTAIGTRRRTQRRGGASLPCFAHHHQKRHSHDHRGKDGKTHGHAKHPPAQQGGLLPLWGSAVHVVEDAVEHTTAWSREQASRLSASVEASLPPLPPPSRDELWEHGPAYAALGAFAFLVAWLFRRLITALWRLLFRRERQQPQAASARQQAVAEKSVAAAAAVGDDPVVIPDADSTAALQRIGVAGAKLDYASTLWVITSLLVLFSSDLLNTVSSLRP